MIKTAICDNNLNNAIIIKNSIEQFSYKFRLRCYIIIYSYGIVLIIDHHKYKAIFINTNIKDKSADNIARYIRMSGEKTRLIFISDNGNIIFYILKFSIMSHKGIKTFRFVEKVWMDNLLSALTSLSRSWFLLFSMVRSPDFYTVLRCVFLSWFLIYPSQYPLFRSSD